jgi:hypothetical protein
MIAWAPCQAPIFPLHHLTDTALIPPDVEQWRFDMISLEDCIALCGLTEQEVMAIAEHEHVPEIAAAAMGRYLLKKPNGPEKIRDMMRDDIHDALSRGDKDHASELLMVLRHFLATHPEAQRLSHRS